MAAKADDSLEVVRVSRQKVPEHWTWIGSIFIRTARCIPRGSDGRMDLALALVEEGPGLAAGRGGGS